MKNEKSSKDAPDYVAYICRVKEAFKGMCGDPPDDIDQLLSSEIEDKYEWGVIDDAELDYRG